MNIPADIAHPLARAGERLGMFRNSFRWYEEIGSTNDAAIALAEAGRAEGAVVAADCQTTGRGRLGRTWASPAGAGVYVSVVLRPDLAAARTLPIAAGVAISSGIQEATGLATQLKWPNDVVINDRKVAGILAEAGTAPGGKPWVVLGFGINVLTASLPPDVAGRATSLEQELGRLPDRGLVLAECLAALAARYGDLVQGRRRDLIAEWRRRAAQTFGRRVAWDDNGIERRGILDDIDDDGAVIVRTPEGPSRILSGELRWI